MAFAVRILPGVCLLAPLTALAQPATSSGAFPATTTSPPAAPAAAPASPAVEAPASPTTPPDAAPAAAAPPKSIAAAPGAETPLPINEPPPPPPRETDLRPNRVRRPFFIGGELGWNGLSGLGVNFSYHPIPYFAMDAGLGVALTGIRLGLRARANLLTSEWTPFLGVGITYSEGTNGKSLDLQSRGETAKLKLLPSEYLQLAGGVNYTGHEGFVFMATTGYARVLAANTRFVSGNSEAYADAKRLYRGGLILSVAFGYAF